MYFVKKIGVDNDKYLSSEIVCHTVKTISIALQLLEQKVVSYIREEGGKQVSDNIKIIDIHDLGQTCEPAIDTMLIYRVASDPHRLHVYQRKTKVVPGTIYGHTLVSEFRRIQIFELEEYKEWNSTIVQLTIPEVELVSVGQTKLKIPKSMTDVPVCNLLDELKQSPKFKTNFALTNTPPIGSGTNLANANLANANLTLANTQLIVEANFALANTQPMGAT